MGQLFQSGLACAGVAFAGGAGYFLWGAYEALARRAHHGHGIRELGEGGTAPASLGRSAWSLDERVVAFAQGESRKESLGKMRRVVPDRLASAVWVEKHAPPAGLGNSITRVGFWEARVRLCLGFAVVGAAVGSVVSVGFAVLLLLAGAVAGWRVLPQSILRRAASRARDLERHLPEMLDVVALGMRSGLSFDRSIELYASHFDTLLASSFELALRQWSCGLVPRDEALRKVASTYDSPLFARVVEGAIRSLRFGSSMADRLEVASREARASYRVSRQEQVAKAPVKMMVPTGTLILPAMLMLVLGPVLLELMGGF